MTSSNSASNSSPDRLLALALLCVACRSDGDWVHRSLDLTIEDPRGVVLELEITGMRPGQPVDGQLGGFITNLGSDTCHVAIYAHTAPPDPAAIPVLTGPPAPDGPGELLFETVIPSSGEFEPFSRPIGNDYGFNGPTFELVESGSLRAWLTIATCAQPDVRAQLDVEVDWLEKERRRDEIVSRLDITWP
jgi:hypothetical protein